MPTKQELEAAAEAFKRAQARSLTEAELEAAAEADPDNPPVTDEELARAVRVTPLTPAK